LKINVPNATLASGRKKRRGKGRRVWKPKFKRDLLKNYYKSDAYFNEIFL